MNDEKKVTNARWLAAAMLAAGFLLGAIGFHTRAAAQSGSVHVTSIPMTGTNPGHGIVSGSVIGFSCVPDTTNQNGTPGDRICYVASR
jgi:hypothetical protein